MSWNMDRGSLSQGLAISAQVTNICLLIVIFGLAGGWADDRFGTQWCGPLGFLLGFGLSLKQLLELGQSGTVKKADPGSELNRGQKGDGFGDE